MSVTTENSEYFMYISCAGLTALWIIHVSEDKKKMNFSKCQKAEFTVSPLLFSLR